MVNKIDVRDLVDAQAVAEILGLSQRNTVSLYQRRYVDMPRPVIDLERVAARCGSDPRSRHGRRQPVEAIVDTRSRTAAWFFTSEPPTERLKRSGTPWCSQHLSLSVHTPPDRANCRLCATCPGQDKGALCAGCTQELAQGMDLDVAQSSRSGRGPLRLLQGARWLARLHLSKRLEVRVRAHDGSVHPSRPHWWVP